MYVIVYTCICGICMWELIHVCAVCEYVFVVRYIWIGSLDLHLHMCECMLCLHVYPHRLIYITCYCAYTMWGMCLYSCILYAHPCLHTCMFMRMCTVCDLDRSYVFPITSGHKDLALYTSVYVTSRCVGCPHWQKTACFVPRPTSCQRVSMWGRLRNPVGCRGDGLDIRQDGILTFSPASILTFMASTAHSFLVSPVGRHAGAGFWCCHPTLDSPSWVTSGPQILLAAVGSPFTHKPILFFPYEVHRDCVNGSLWLTDLLTLSEQLIGGQVRAYREASHSAWTCPLHRSVA